MQLLARILTVLFGFIVIIVSTCFVWTVHSRAAEMMLVVGAIYACFVIMLFLGDYMRKESARRASKSSGTARSGRE